MKKNHDHHFNPFTDTMYTWPSLFNRAMASFWSGAIPDNLEQPILPGWMFANEINVTRQNSSSPETEHDIVAQESYGKQIGRLMDAVMALIDERPEGSASKAPFDALSDQYLKIKQIKALRHNWKIKQLEDDLEQLRKTSPDEYRRIASLMNIRLKD